MSTIGAFGAAWLVGRDHTTDIAVLRVDRSDLPQAVPVGALALAVGAEDGARVQATSWTKDPWTLGAFSSAPPGAQEARKALSEPLKDVVWFAGEAVHQTLWGTVGGAWQNGERAADAVIARLDHKS